MHAKTSFERFSLHMRDIENCILYVELLSRILVKLAQPMSLGRHLISASLL